MAVSSSSGGCVLGMAQMVVNPPATAAAAAVAMVSSSSWPGSRQWTCRSIRPGQTILPAASITCRACAPAFTRPTLAIRPPAIGTSARSSRRGAGSITRAVPDQNYAFWPSGRCLDAKIPAGLCVMPRSAISGRIPALACHGHVRSRASITNERRRSRGDPKMSFMVARSRHSADGCGQPWHPRWR